VTVDSLKKVFDQMSIDILLLPYPQQLEAMIAELGQSTKQFSKLDDPIRQELYQLDVSSEISRGVIRTFFNGQMSMIPPRLQVQVT
jgi:hypothetical protein